MNELPEGVEVPEEAVLVAAQHRVQQEGHAGLASLKESDPQGHAEALDETRELLAAALPAILAAERERVRDALDPIRRVPMLRYAADAIGPANFPGFAEELRELADVLAALDSTKGEEGSDG